MAALTKENESVKGLVEVQSISKVAKKEVNYAQRFEGVVSKESNDSC